jgi:hypothetical protein
MSQKRIVVLAWSLKINMGGPGGVATGFIKCKFYKYHHPIADWRTNPSAFWVRKPYTGLIHVIPGSGFVNLTVWKRSEIEIQIRLIATRLAVRSGDAIFL